MHDFTRRSLLQGGTALAAAGALTGPALLEFAKAWAQTSPWKAEPGAKLTVMRWKRFVPAEDDAFNAMVAAFKTATGTEMNVFSSPSRTCSRRLRSPPIPARVSISPGACTRCRSCSRPKF